MSSIVPNRSERSGSGASLSPRSDVSSPPSSPSFGAHRFTHQPHHDYQDSPPFSRILVVCDRTLSEKDVYDAFSKFGDIEFTKLARNKGNRSKEICYIKYYKTSAAAKAIEKMDGKQLDEIASPLKVQIAETRYNRKLKYSSEPEDTPARSRLFIVCPKDLHEDQLTAYFGQFDNLEYCKVIVDRVTNQSKGFGYVKFSMASSAAEGMEQVNEEGMIDGMRVKVLIADPKAKRSTASDSPPSGMFMGNFGYSSQPMDIPMSSPPQMDPMMRMQYDMFMMGQGAYPQSPGSSFEQAAVQAFPGYYYDPISMSYYPAMQRTAASLPPVPSRLFVVCHKTVTQDDLASLFSQFHGMDYCDLKINKETGESRGYAFVNFTSSQFAYVAKETLDGCEFPPGSKSNLKVLYAEPQKGVDEALGDQAVSPTQSSPIEISSPPMAMGSPESNALMDVYINAYMAAAAAAAQSSYYPYMHSPPMYDPSYLMGVSQMMGGLQQHQQQHQQQNLQADVESAERLEVTPVPASLPVPVAADELSLAGNPGRPRTPVDDCGAFERTLRLSTDSDSSGSPIQAGG